MEFEAESIHFNNYIQPICFLDPENEPIVPEGIVLGWGKSENPTRRHENIPKLVKVMIQTNEKCFFTTRALLDLSSEGTFCAGQMNGSGVCHGDSGGGLFIKIDGAYYLKGIVSSSLLKNDGCDVSTNAVYTNVPKLRDSIERMTGGKLVVATQGGLANF